MDRTVIALLIIAVFIAVFTVPTARSSVRRQKIRGGAVASAFHMLGVAGYIGVVPAALCGSILAGPLEFGIPLAITLLVISLLSLMIYAAAEKPFRTQMVSEDRGWTAEDARKSGL